MELTQAGKDLIKKFEGCRLDAYQDVGKLWTIGYGHRGGVAEGMVITEEQADAILDEDIRDVCDQVRAAVSNHLTDNQFSAVVSFVFNVGIGRFRTSTMRKLIQSGDMDWAADQFLAWNHVGGEEVAGLTTRRKAERELFLTA